MLGSVDASDRLARGEEGHMRGKRVATASIRLTIASAVVMCGLALGAGSAMAGDQLWAWGPDIQFSLGASGSHRTPVAVEGIGGSGTLADAAGVAAGGEHGLAVLDNGEAVAWGDNAYGQLGNGSTVNSQSPVPVENEVGTATLSDVEAVAAGELHSLALADGDVFSWGYNTDGQLGNGSTTNSSLPVTVTGLTGISQIVAGDNDSFALSGQNNEIWAWGENNDGQLGNNATTNEDSPVGVQGIGGNGADAVAAGASFALALVNFANGSGSVDAWGANNDGQLGTNSTVGSEIPVAVAGVGGSGALTGVTQIAAGENHSLALLSGSTVVAWGDGAEGQLGDNSSSNSEAPVAVSNLTNVVEIAATANDSYALESNGTLWAWGENASGQLGDNSMPNSKVPVQVADLGIGVDGSFGFGPTIASGPAAADMFALAHPVAQLTPASVPFGTQAQDTIGPAQALTLTNIGAPGLTEDSTDTSGSDPDDFIKSNDTCQNASLNDAASCTIDMRFAPEAATGTAESATLNVDTSAPGTQPTASLTGTAGSLPQGPAGSNGSNGTNGTDGSSGSIGPQGPQGLQGQTGPRGPAGQVELVTCTPVKHGKKTVNKCTTRVVSGTVSFTTTAADRASIARGSTVYATGELVSRRHGRTQLLLYPRRALRPGSYMLLTTVRDRGRLRTSRTEIWIR